MIDPGAVRLTAKIQGRTYWYHCETLSGAMHLYAALKGTLAAAEVEVWENEVKIAP